MKKFYHLLVTRYELQVTSYKLQVERFKRFTSHLIPLTAYLFLFLPFSTFAQTPDPGCNCIKFDNLCWATCNVAEPGTFAAPTDTGWYYQWGVNVGWNPTTLEDSNGGTTWSSTSPPAGSPPNPDEWLITPCPAGWRLPTRLEFVDLVTYMITNGTTLDKYGTLSGRFFDSGDPTQPLLFLVAAGSRRYNDGRLENVGTNGDYWSSTQYSTATRAYNLDFTRNSVNPSNISSTKANGYTLRCVADL